MYLTQHLLYALLAFILNFLQQETLAELAAVENPINNLYDNLLQREYAGPVVFPNHQVERKAVRSPSLRLRFGRRSDPDLMPAAEKRWFGDVNQKPIRSPSLRLRFGRRSDPSMPLHSSLDALLNDLVVDDSSAALEDYFDGFEGYERVLRKPQRLRFGRSQPIVDKDAMEQYEREARKPQRLRFGRSLTQNEHAQLNGFEIENVEKTDKAQTQAEAQEKN